MLATGMLLIMLHANSKHEDQYIMIAEAKCSQQELIAARFCQFGELLLEKCDKTEPPDATLADVRTLSLTCRPVGKISREKNEASGTSLDF